MKKLSFILCLIFGSIFINGNAQNEYIIRSNMVKFPLYQYTISQPFQEVVKHFLSDLKDVLPMGPQPLLYVKFRTSRTVDFDVYMAQPYCFNTTNLEGFFVYGGYEFIITSSNTAFRNKLCSRTNKIQRFSCENNFELWPDQSHIHFQYKMGDDGLFNLVIGDKGIYRK